MKIRSITSLLIAIVFSAMIFAGCNSTSKDTNNSDIQSNNEVTDLQLALLNSILFNDSLTELEGKQVEGHDELINNNYKEHISGGDKLVDELKGYTLIDYDYGDITGFKAAAFTKGDNLVIVFGGTDHWTDFVDDVFGGLFDFSAMDGQAKAFAKDNAKKYEHHNLYITGYSMGGRLCYLGTEAVIDDSLAGNLKKVRTFNGLGVKEIINIKDSNWSNIHYLESLFGDKTYDYIVKGDIVSDEDANISTKRMVGYNHVGTEYKVPCTNQIDSGFLKQHDLYSIIDYLLNNPAPAENNSSVKNLDSKSVLVVSSEDHNLIGEFINVSGDTRVNTWNTFASKYPQAADPMDQGREYFSKMHITLFFLKDNEGNVIDNKGVMNATGFGSDPCEWNETDEAEYFFFDGNTILIEKDLRDDISRLGRRHYTEAHEAGHQILQKLFPEDYEKEKDKLHFCLANTEPQKIRDWKEWQADTLASVLLMPKELVIQAMQLFGLGEKIYRLNRVWAVAEYEKFCSMARLLGVSKQALSIRMTQLELIEHNDLNNPYAAIDIEYE